RRGDLAGSAAVAVMASTLECSGVLGSQTVTARLRRDSRASAPNTVIWARPSTGITARTTLTRRRLTTPLVALTRLGLRRAAMAAPEVEIAVPTPMAPMMNPVTTRFG